MNSNLSADLAIFPAHFIRQDDGTCSCGKADCGNPGKHPLTSRGLHDATKDKAQIAKWWKVNPQANVGIATGAANGLVVIDIDPKHGGSESLLSLEEKYGLPPETVEVETGGGGLHLYFRYPPGADITSKNGWMPGIDIKANGGYVIGVGSLHRSGKRYQFAEGRSPAEIEIAELPAWLLELLPRKDKSQVQPTNGKYAADGNSSHAFTFTSGSASLLDRARAYADKAEAASEGGRNDAAFRLAGHITAFDERGDRLNESDIFDIISRWNQRNNPPLSDSELRQCVRSALINGTARPVKESTIAVGTTLPKSSEACPKFLFCDLRQQYPTLNKPIVHGLFRAGETVNLVSTSKVGKSWLAYSLGLSVIANRRWLETFEVEPGEVLLVDNELHRCTLSHRIPAVADKLGIHCTEYAHQLEVWPLRGDLRDIVQLGHDFASIEPGRFKLIILDAKYRLGIPGRSENDNASETQVYNLLDQHAAQTGAAFVLVHHSSKGSQAEKRVTDVGAGAGAQSRAADCHIVLREHAQDGVVVLDAAVRSFAPVTPLPLKWEFPLWLPARDIDATKLKGKLNRGEQQQQEKDREGREKVLKALRKCGPLTRSKLITETGMGKDRLQRLLGQLTSTSDIECREITERGNRCDEYALPELPTE